MTKYDIETPYTAVYIILRQDSKIAMVLRSGTDWMNGHYGLVAGKVDRGESFLTAAVREAKEEAGVDIDPKDFEQVMVAHRKEPDSIWVDMFFETSKWEGEPYNAEPHMHSELAWFEPDKLPQNTIPAIRFYIESFQAGKAYVEYGWSN